MGVSCSCLFAESNDVETGLESMIVKSISFGDNVSKTPARSISFNDKTPVPTILKSLGSGKMIVEKSVSFKGRQFEGTISVNKSSDQHANDTSSSNLDTENPEHEAAIKLQKVYKSFRTRRKLADCAVLVEQSWWKLLDFAELKRSSISFFDIEKHETAISRWSRARTRAAKVGKGLSKNAKAQKLALQHWLEAIDPRHRYGHNLHFYYNKWLHCQSREPFFYWLDIGEGREVNLIAKCPRWKLQQQCIKYLGPKERERFEVIVPNGKFYYKHSGEVLHTSDEDDDAKWIFVLSTSKVLYVGKKKKGRFQHSSFLAGGATIAAGRLIVENGVLKAVWPHSGHYQPTEDNFKDFISYLNENKVDLSDVKTSPRDTDEYSVHKQRSTHVRNDSFEDDFPKSSDCIKTGKNTGVEANQFEPQTNYETPERAESSNMFEDENRILEPNETKISDGYESADDEEEEDEAHEASTQTLDKEEESDQSEDLKIPEEAILKRINSKKGTKSFQLGRQLPCKWTTGAGPRIGCVRDYPSELQFRALEKVNLSPRSGSVSRTAFSPQIQNSQLWRGTSLPAEINLS